MATPEAQKGGLDIGELLKPFYQRASEAEDRLSRLEVALASKKDAENEELWKTISELQSKLEDANTELISEQEKVRKLAAENAKLQYRVLHLVRALHECDAKPENLSGSSEERAEVITKLKDMQP
ncbi:hypothetical protein JCGZ_21121 [Jatropha curcas]|uniref:Uncharacterized protein n=1 Tax=Jatropha curcas TaxID=180498 RepID=A0A067JTC8_JATCU|nr:hypothetical protein JCGZ_21121 [Jatropha curcas]